MKALIVLVLVVAAGVGVFLWMGGTKSEKTVGVQTAFGNLQGQTIVFEAILTDALASAEFPDTTASHATWQEWIATHLEMVDEKQNAVPLSYANANTLPSLGASRGSTDVGYLHATVKPGQTYTLRFKPIAKGGQRFSAKLDAPKDASPMKLVTLR